MRAERLVFGLKRQLVHSQQTAFATQPAPWNSQPVSSNVPLAHGDMVPMDNTVVYLGETCAFDVSLSNQGAPVSAVTLKVECSVEGGSTAVLYDNSQSPLQLLAFNAEEQLRVQTDIKDQGLITIVASAVFTDQTGERKYHVQFFKFHSASPVSVRTRVRHLAHAITASHTGAGCGFGGTRCFLEVNVQNSTTLVMQLHAVRLLAAPGVAALHIPEQKQQQQLAHIKPHEHQKQISSITHIGFRQDQEYHQPYTSRLDAGLQQPSPAGLACTSNSSDTELMQDTDTFAGNPAPYAVPSAQPKQQAVGSDQPQQLLQQQQNQPWQSAYAPSKMPGQHDATGQSVPLPAGSSYNALWQIDHQLAGPHPGTASSTTDTSTGGVGGPPSGAPSATGTSGPSSTGSSSGSSSTLGRLELHWSTRDGRTGRLLTQPLTGPVPASGKEVLMQLHQVLPGSPLDNNLSNSAAASPAAGKPVLLSATLMLNHPFTASFTLTAGAQDAGPLLVLYTTAPPPMPAGSISSSSGITTDSSSVQARRLDSTPQQTPVVNSSAEVVVQGSRSRRIPLLRAGQSVDVSFELLPFRRGWLRLPTFVVASEVDGRLLDGVHDVHVLVL